MTSHLKGNAATNGQGFLQRPLMKNTETVAKDRHIDGIGNTPIYGGSPNNAELVDNVVYAELGSVPPPPLQPQTKQRRLLLGNSSFTKYLRSLGAIKGGASVKSDVSNHERIIQGVQNTRPPSLSPTFHINLDINNRFYSHENCVKKGIPNLDRQRTRSPDEYRRSASSSTRRWLNRVPEEMEVPPSDGVPEGIAVKSDAPNINSDGHRLYGSVGYGTTRTNLGSGPNYVAGVLVDHDEDDSDLSEEEEEEEWLLDEELAKQGLYRGNYKNLVLLYTSVPLSTLLAFVFLALLPSYAFPSSNPSQFPYPPYLPFPLPELFTATALWALSYLLRDFLYATSVSGTNLMHSSSHQFPTFIPVLTSIVSAFLQNASALFFRLLAVPILLIPYYSTEHVVPPEGQLTSYLHKRHFPTWQDDAFRRVWWVALGWAAAEAVVGIKQGYESIALYKDVLVTAKKSATSKMEIVALGRDEEDQLLSNDPATHATSVHRRSVTPTQSRSSEHDSNPTPTQRDHQKSIVDDFTHPSSAVLQSQRRDPSSSTSSINLNFIHNAPSHGQGRVGDAVGEREPLLNPDSRPRTLSRRPTDEISRLSVENEVERDLDQLLAFKSREELEEVYGIPVIHIPVAISCLHRINSILSSLGIYLLMTAAYMRSAYAYPSSTQSITSSYEIHQDPPSNKALAITFPSLLILQVLLSMMHTPWILPRIGIHTFVYVGLLASLGLFFGGLGVWEALT